MSRHIVFPPYADLRTAGDKLNGLLAQLEAEQQQWLKVFNANVARNIERRAKPEPVCMFHKRQALG